MKKSSITQLLKNTMVMGVVTMGVFSCTKLEDVSLDKVTDGSSIPPAQLLASANSYMYIYPSNGSAMSMNEITTDEMQAPTRGTDWDDNGVWRQIHEHAWTPTNGNVVLAWDEFNKGHALANEVINNSNSSAKVKAQATFARAYYMYHIMDLFGKVPFKETVGGQTTAKVLTRPEAFAKIVLDLEASIASLDEAGSTPVQSFTATKQAAQALLTKLYLNKGVYTNATLAGPYTFAAADMDKVISLSDAITASGKFAINKNYFDNFVTDNDQKSKELVFNIPYTGGVNPSPSADGYGSNQRMIYPGTHYNQNPSGWNGFTTLSDFYNSFEAGDLRTGGQIIDKSVSGITYGFLVGQQFDKTGAKLTDRQGKDLVFTIQCPLNGAVEKEGVRVIKYQPDFANPISGANDFGFIRYADILLMKAEALLRKGDAAAGLTIVNQIRTARGLKTLATLTEANLLAERGHELYNEGWRRNDLVRFNKFNDPVINRSAASPATRRIFPIPQKEVEINPQLTQNEGY
jgi:starch-binding outer membrane protein, SusD/RagB family